MKTFLIHHTPCDPAQDTWAVSFSLPYIAASYARAGDGLWYVKTWLSAEQIRKRLAILFDDPSELTIGELSREAAAGLRGRTAWLEGRLEYEEPVSFAVPEGPRAAWSAFQSAVAEIVKPLAASFGGAMAST